MEVLSLLLGNQMTENVDQYINLKLTVFPIIWN